jgi:predicted ATPase/class 3 adenylate cyclase
MQICPSCGEENPDRFRLCGICGTQLAPQEVAQEVRKTVTVLYTDLKGSTALGETLDPEALREALNIYFNEMRGVLESHGGKVEKYIGDAIVAVFGLPKAHEDDALRAVRAAADMQRTLGIVNEKIERHWGVRLHNRTGLNTGEVVAGDVSAGQHLVTGDTINTAARIEAAAPTDEVLMGEPTYRLVKHAVEAEAAEPIEAKGKAEPVVAYRLTSVTEGEGIKRRLDTPLVGRSAELKVLTDALESARTHRHAEIVTVVGPAGVGKSRLLHELLVQAGDDVVSVHGRCLSYGDGITFYPFAEMVREAADIENDDVREVARSKLTNLLGQENANVAERVEATIGLTAAPFPQEEIFWGVRRFLEILATKGPCIALIDDIHWAEQTFLDLLRYLLDSIEEAPVVLVCSARPDLILEHPDWTPERAEAHMVELEPLSDDESSLVIDNVLGTAALDEEARDRVVKAAQGNPLFVEQMLSMLIDDGILQRDSDGNWVLISDFGSFSMPPSISALLTARLDRLGPSERAVIERGAVIGLVFFRGAVEDLAPNDVKEHVEASLTNLIRKDFVGPHESEFAGQESYAFIHGMIRDATYHALLKRARAELHEGFVGWAERVAPERVMEYEEILGYHLEQSYLIRVQLGPLDDHGVQVGLHGNRYLAAAGRRALSRADMPAAASLLQRAAALLQEDHADRPKLLMEAGEALIELGEFEMADGLLATAEQEATKLGDRAVEAGIQLARLNGEWSTGAEGMEQHFIEKVEEVMPVLESLQYHEGLARAWRLLTLVHGTALRIAAAEETTERAVEQARLAGNRMLEVRYLSMLATCALLGPTPVPEAIMRCQGVLEAAGGDRKTEALTHGFLSQLEAMQGNFDRARELYRQSRAMFEEYGMRLYAALTSIKSGPVELLAGDPKAAEDELRRDYEALEQMGDRNYRSTVAGLLAEALYQQGRLDEAEEFAEIGREISAPDDPSSECLWRCVLGKVQARRGEVDQGLRLVTEAIDMASASDFLDDQGIMFTDLAEVHELAGRPDEAAAALEEALRMFEAKADTVAIDRTRDHLARLRVSA